MSNNKSIILNADSYKASHWLQYPPNTEYVYSYIEPRNSSRLDKCVFFGLQVFLKEVLTKPITQADIDFAAVLFQNHGVPFYKEGWQYILDNHKGYLPIAIEALNEGEVVPLSTAVVQIVNTDPKCYWLTSYVETALLRAVWYPSTVASLALACRKVIQKGMETSCDTLDKLPFMLQDFGFRGTSSYESAALGGLAHLLSFKGTDNIAALLAAQDYYGIPVGTAVGYSIAAAEHSTITSWGRENETKAYANMLEQFSKPGALVAVVSDSYDLFNAIENIWGTELKDKVINSGGTLVIRPDSGVPSEVVLKSLQLLEKCFGVTVNGKGYKVLPDCVRLIQGDGINLESLQGIIDVVIENGYSLDNLAFGMGGGLLQQLDRDTMGWAMKASCAIVDGEARDVFKDPITSTSKRSKKGILDTVFNVRTLEIETIRRSEVNENHIKLFDLVFYNGRLLVEHDFEEIRQFVSSVK